MIMGPDLPLVSNALVGEICLKGKTKIWGQLPPRPSGSYVPGFHIIIKKFGSNCTKHYYDVTLLYDETDVCLKLARKKEKYELKQIICCDANTDELP